MKDTIKLMGYLVVGILAGCSKSDDGGPKEIALQNEPPLSFNLIDVPDGSLEIDVKPALSWESAENPKGGSVTYDLHLDTNLNPSTIYKSDINATSIHLEDRLSLLTDYRWKVVARDANGQMSQSSTNKFTTRDLNISEEPVTAAPGFSGRFDHNSVVFNNKIWVLGGFDGELKNDVWYSSDGIEWTKATASAAFSARAAHVSVVFDNKIWVIGGFDGELKNDVWYSSDGIEWIKATGSAAFSTRTGHAAAVFDDKIWVIGGSDTDFDAKNDVWYSSDGINWFVATGEAAFPQRSNHEVVAFDNKLWVIGGVFPFQVLNDIWFSSDGTTWEQSITTSVFSERSGHSTCVFGNELWLAGGSDIDGVRKNDVWYSSNGTDWTSAASPGLFPGRYRHSSVVFDDKLWIIAGLGNEDFENDVWALD